MTLFHLAAEKCLTCTIPDHEASGFMVTVAIGGLVLQFTVAWG